MSTTIHDAYQFAAGTDVLAVSAVLRARAERVHQQLVDRACVHGAVTLHDQAAHAQAAAPKRALHTAWHQLRKDFTEFGATELEVVFLTDPAARLDEPRLYAVALSRDDFRSIWDDLPEAVDFAYWNNTDRPADVTETAWEARRQVWNRVVQRGPVRTQGLVLTVVSATGPVPVTGSGWAVGAAREQQLSPALLPDRASRARTLARDVLLGAACHAEQKRTAPFTDGLGAVMGYVEEHLDRVSAELEPTLRELTLDDLC